MALTPQEKIEQLERLLADDPEDHLGLFMLGKLYMDVENHEKAVDAFQRCLDLKPDYSAAYRHCGDAYRKLGDNASAREVYRLGIEVADANGDLQTVKEMQAFLRKLEQ